MKLLYQLKENHTLNKHVGEQLLKDIEKLPTFSIITPPVFYKNWLQKRFIVDNNSNLIALVSKQFRLTQPRENLRKLVSLIKDDVTEYSIYYYSGTVIAKIKLKEIVDFDDSRLKLGLIYQDSVERKSRLKIVFAPTLLECMNDLVVKRHSLHSRHVGLIKQNVEKFIELFRDWLYDLSILKLMKKRMKEEILSMNAFENILKDLKLPKQYLKDIEWREDYSLWDLYMDLTRNLTRMDAPIDYHLRIAKLSQI